MTKKEKELIDSALNIDEKDLLDLYFDSIYIINSGKLYNGFWGKNDFKNIIILGQINNQLINITHATQCDVLDFQIGYNDIDHPLSFEIHKDTNCFHLFFINDKYKFKVTNLCSTVSIKTEFATDNITFKSISN